VDRIQIGHKRKVAFICSGGGSKAGAFHLGVARALQESGFRFYGGRVPHKGPIIQPGPMEISTYVGSSAGSIISAYLAAGYSLENIFASFLGKKRQSPIPIADATPKILPRLTYPKMFKIRGALAKEQLSQLSFSGDLLYNLLGGNWESLFQFKWLKTTGVFSTQGIEQYVREEVLDSNRFQDYLADLFIVATQLNHSRKVVFGKYSYQPPPHDLTCQYDNDVPISQACAASTALPLIYAPYEIRGSDGKITHYIDGEIRDTLSSHVAVDAGADLVFASYTHQPYHFNNLVGSLTSQGLPAILIQSIYLVIEQKINNHIHNKQVQRNAIMEVDKYCKTNNVPDQYRKRICEILERELHHRTDIDTIYIHPKAADSQNFFVDNFSLSSKNLTEAVRSGYRAAMETLSKYEFADKNMKSAAPAPAPDQAHA
jgi:predicted acylesterase/phospholipase RssA